ncbi:FKH2 [Candida jiufengensis]|uniref:FKH2 n=1 Tax=Candida jiufengensis TaxID=497108 RepID=UPI002224097A|nr:FKH2 [Candida jiufengensis]KAI5953214.1 FKH2 [Candida jiufengensis]
MSSFTTPRKRTLNDHLDNSNDFHTFNDPQDRINAVMSTLQCPDEKTNVSETYANSKNLATEVQAYAKIAGKDWTYYVKTLAISIGRNTEVNNNNSNNNNINNGPLIDIDLGPAKIVSRQHATITYNLDLRCWELKVLGRNGARIDGQKVSMNSSEVNGLHSGAILDVGGTQMMFILPDSPPVVAPKMLDKAVAKYREEHGGKTNKRLNYNGSNMINNGGSGSGGSMKSFQVYNKAQLNHSPSSISANSLQSNLDQDLSKEDSKDIKPPYSYATMITQAILSNPSGVMSLSDIYNWISSHYAYYKYSKTGWQNSIRHNLSLNKAFEKVPRRPNEPGKGMKWQISSSYKEDFLTKINDGTISKTRRGSSVSRQLSLHLATHNHLPEAQVMEMNDVVNQYHHPHQPHQLSQLSQPPPQQQQQQPSNQQQPPSQQQQAIQPPPQQSFYDHQRSNSKNLQYNNNLVQNQIGYAPQQNMYPQSGRSYSYTQQQQSQIQQQQQPLMYGQQTNQQYPINNGYSSNLASPLRQPQQLHQQRDSISKMPKMQNNQSLYNLPPPNNQDTKINLGHSRTSSYITNNNQLPDNGGITTMNHSYNSNQNDSLNSIPISSNNTTTNEVMNFTSPKKISQLEAYTPERGSNQKQNLNQVQQHQNQNGKNSNHLVPTGGQQQPNQSSPAFWNFVQFSTPNGQTPIKRNSNGEEIDDDDDEEDNNQRNLKEDHEKSPLLKKKLNKNNNNTIKIESKTGIVDS